MTPPPFSYARWHARDGLVRAITPVLLFTLMAGMPIGIMLSELGLEAARVPGTAQEMARTIYGQMLPLAMTLGALVVASGHIAQDRVQGHVRFLFAAPVVPWRYYLERFLIGLALFVAAMALVPVGFGALVTPVPVWPVAAAAALVGLLVGSLALLAGALTRHDGAIVIAVTLVASISQAMVRARTVEPPAWFRGLAAALPPIDGAGQVRDAWMSGLPADTGQLVHVLGYALAMLVAALLVIRRAPLVR